MIGSRAPVTDEERELRTHPVPPCQGPPFIRSHHPSLRVPILRGRYSARSDVVRSESDERVCTAFVILRDIERLHVELARRDHSADLSMVARTHGQSKGSPASTVISKSPAQCCGFDVVPTCAAGSGVGPEIAGCCTRSGATRTHLRRQRPATAL